MDRVLRSMADDRIGPGDLSISLAKNIARYLHMSGGISVSSYTAAIELALQTLGIERNDAVVLSPLAPLPYRQVLERLGARLLFADVDVEYGMMQSTEIDRLLSQKPALIVAHHTLGVESGLDDFMSHRVPVLEDVSHSLCAVGARDDGLVGDIRIVSLAHCNIITAGGGAVVVARDSACLAKLRRTAKAYAPDWYLPDMNAALGVAQLERIDEMTASRKQIAEIYQGCIAKTRHRSIHLRNGGWPTLYSFPVVIRDRVADARKYARKHGVCTEAAFADSAINGEWSSESCPHAASIASRCLLFPLYPSLRKREVQTVAKVLSSLP